MLWAVEQGIVSGDTIKPDVAVTRTQVATFLYRSAGSPAATGGDSFSDVPADAYFVKPVAWVAAKEITAGTEEHTFNLDGVCTRGQIDTFLYWAQK